MVTRFGERRGAEADRCGHPGHSPVEHRRRGPGHTQTCRDHVSRKPGPTMGAREQRHRKTEHEHERLPQHPTREGHQPPVVNKAAAVERRHHRGQLRGLYQANSESRREPKR